MAGQTIVLRRATSGGEVASPRWLLVRRLVRELAFWRWRRARRRAGEVLAPRRRRGRAYMLAPSRHELVPEPVED